MGGTPHPALAFFFPVAFFACGANYPSQERAIMPAARTTLQLQQGGSILPAAQTTRTRH